MKHSIRLHVLLWSIALPGFGQLLNRKYFKAATLILLELIINDYSRLNSVIIKSFFGRIEEAIKLTNYQWLLFYPCVYMFAIWDAYRDVSIFEEMKIDGYSCLPFVIAGYIGTIGVIYSSTFSIFGFVLGPVWLPMIALTVGATIGYILSLYLRRTKK